MTLVTSPAILLRAHPYSDSSRILRFLTRERGLVSLVGRGVRTRASKGEGALETFAEGVVSFTHRPSKDLHTLRSFERTSGALGLGRELTRFLGASLLAEILLSHTLEEGDPELYDWSAEVFDRLGRAEPSDVPGWVLAGSWRALSHLGFTPEVGRCISCGREPAWGEGEELHRLDPTGGGILCPECAPGSALARIGPRAQADLMALVGGEPPSSIRGLPGHLRFLEAFAVHHLAPRKPFRSFAQLRPLFASAEGRDPSSPAGVEAETA